MDAVKHFLYENREAIFSVASAIAAFAFFVYVLILILRLVRWFLRTIKKAFHWIGKAIGSVLTAVGSIGSKVFTRLIASHPLNSASKTSAVVFAATHLVYLSTFVIGVIISAKTLVEGVAPKVTKNLMFVFPMLTFAVANCIHQSLIYRDVRDAENPHAVFFKRYDGWWLGTGLERIVRLLAMICLLGLAGELPLEQLGFFANLKGSTLDPDRFVMFANCGLYALILLWNIVARIRLRWHASVVQTSLNDPNAASETRSHLNQSMVSDTLALGLWITVVNVSENRQLFAAFVTTLAVLYLINIVWYRPRARPQFQPRDRLQRVFLALSVLAVLAMLDRDALRKAIDANVQNTRNVVEQIRSAEETRELKN